jgi:YbbR domain-containing protein
VKNILLNNLGTKISALLIAVFLWFFVTSQGQSELTLDAPIEFKDIPVSLGIVGSNAKTVSLTIRGQERFMKSLNSADIRVFIDMRKAQQGEAQYPVAKEDVKLPFAMTITNIAPTSVKVRLEEMITRTVSVQPQLIGAPEKGIASVTVEPKFVVIRGLRSEVRKISFLKTEEFDISDIKGPVTEELELKTAGMNVMPETGKVRVKIIPADRKR